MKPTPSYQHKKSSRVLIPSHEEAGEESQSPAVSGAPGAVEIPKNPVVTRGKDPELFWLGKYGADDSEDTLRVDIRSLYRHEHIVPENIISGLYRMVDRLPGSIGEETYLQQDLFSVTEAFGSGVTQDDLEKPSSYYTHADGWSNRLIQGDSLLGMSSLLHREGMAGKVQCFYFDPPYGIKYGSNWQIKLNNRTVTDGKDEALSGEPEQIKAFRDTWELGIHSYLSYLRDRLLVARDLLSDSGSCFLQISDENVHLVRCLMDEVFGSGNFCRLIPFVKTSGQTPNILSEVHDYIIWYAKNKAAVKYRQLYFPREPFENPEERYICVETADGKIVDLSIAQKTGRASIPEGRILKLENLTSQTGSENSRFPILFNGKSFVPGASRGWSTSQSGIERLRELNLLHVQGSTLWWKNYRDTFPFRPMRNDWDDTKTNAFGDPRYYVVQTGTKVIQRCILMTTDPGDLVLDPTCGSGTTAYVAEHWGRRWITTDTSRIALNITKTRLMTATFPYYKMHDEHGGDVRQGFQYKKVPHITLRSIANNEPPVEITLFDQPAEDKKRLRVAGPFTVETLQNFEPQSPESLRHQDAGVEAEDLARFEERIFAHLQNAGIKTGDKRENAVFHHIEQQPSTYLHAMGFYHGEDKLERKAYFHIGPKFGTVSKKAVNEAIKECRQRGDADWLVILGFSFESDIENREEKHTADKVKHYQLGSFQVTKVRMHDDLMQEGLLKKDKKAASFVTIGEPDVRVKTTAHSTVQVEIAGLDIYDPITDVVKSRDVHDIAYWMVDDDYDGANFVIRQVFFCGGEADEFSDWQKGLTKLAEDGTRKKAQQTLRVELDEEAFARLYGHLSHPITVTKDDQKLAIRVISQFGEETTKVLSVGEYFKSQPEKQAVKFQPAPKKGAKKAKK